MTQQFQSADAAEFAQLTDTAGSSDIGAQIASAVAPNPKVRVKISPITTSFDFLDGEYAKSRRMHLIGMSVLGLLTAVAIALGFQIIVLSSTIQDAELTRVETASAVSAAEQALTDATGHRGIESDRLRTHAVGRIVTATSIVEHDIELGDLYSTLVSTLQPGMALTALTIEVGQIPVEGRPTVGSSSEAAAPTAPTRSAIWVTTTATITRPEDRPAWVRALNAIPYVDRVDFLIDEATDVMMVSLWISDYQSDRERFFSESLAALGATANDMAPPSETVDDPGSDDKPVKPSGDPVVTP